MKTRTGFINFTFISLDEGFYGKDYVQLDSFLCCVEKCVSRYVVYYNSVDIERGELELPEELPYFPYEKELEEELRYSSNFSGSWTKPNRGSHFYFSSY